MSDAVQDPMRDLAPGYALGALTPEETRAFEAALAANPALQKEVAEYRELNALLAAQDPRTPADELKARLRERIGNRARATSGVRAPSPVRRSFGPVATGMALAAMLLLSIGLSLKVRVLSDAIRTRDSLLSEREGRLAEREATLNSILEPGVQLTTLTATGAQPVVQIFYDKVKRRLVLHAFRLMPVPAGRIYQLWLMPKKGNPIASQTFNTEADGHGLVTSVNVPAGEEISGFALTIEPAGGSPQPTTTPILYGAIAAAQ
jgi:anti-sigma-K factor RskA